MNLPVLASDTLRLYQTEVARFALLSPQEEHELAVLWHDEGDVDAAQKLVLANLRFVIKVAYQYVQYGFPLVDLIQEGNVGLMKAVKRFDPHKGIRLISYAIFWIRAAIHEYIQRSWSLVRIATTRAQRKLFNMLQSTRSALRKAMDQEGGEGEPDAEALARVAEGLKVDVEDLHEVRRRAVQRDLSLDQPVGDEDDRTVGDSMASTWEDPETAAAENDTRVRFERALTRIRPSLNEREQFILEKRLLSDAPVLLDDIGQRFGISKERARQLEAALLKKLRVELEEYGLEAA
jgi:RNA polymerase sigma-32 factor